MALAPDGAPAAGPGPASCPEPSSCLRPPAGGNQRVDVDVGVDVDVDVDVDQIHIHFRGGRSSAGSGHPAEGRQCVDVEVDEEVPTELLPPAEGPASGPQRKLLPPAPSRRPPVH